MANQDDLTNSIQTEENQELFQCSRCIKLKTSANFPKSRTGYRRERCIACYRKYHKQHADSHREEIRISGKKTDLKRHFGMTLNEYRDKLEMQNGVCAICKKPSLDHRSLAVDHDKQTGAIRALLCDKCNRGLGFFNHDTEILETAITYLKAYRSNRFITKRYVKIRREKNI